MIYRQYFLTFHLDAILLFFGYFDTEQPFSELYYVRTVYPFFLAGKIHLRA